MRISDWSSDVCSSDLAKIPNQIFRTRRKRHGMTSRCHAGGHRGRRAASRIDQRRGSKIIGVENHRAVGRTGIGLKNLMGCHRQQRFSQFGGRSEEHTSELQSLMRISYAVFCLKKKKTNTKASEHRSDKNKKRAR